MRIYIGSDHGAFELKEELKNYLEQKGHEVYDEGTYSSESVDYPDIAKKLSAKVLTDKNSKGIMMCGTGIGASIAVNKMPGIRAALCTDEYMARMAREHNDANILCLGGRVIGVELAKSIVSSFVDNKFTMEEKHQRRIQKLENI